MNMTPSEFVAELIEDHYGALMNDRTRKLLKRPLAELDTDEKKAFQSLDDRALTGFIRAASSGFSFGEIEEIKRKFGFSLKQNYPEAGSSFLNLATSYWTLKLYIESLEADTREHVAVKVLENVEGNIGPLFFPVPGPIELPAWHREMMQRVFLIDHRAIIDVEEFLEKNPILVRDRSKGDERILKETAKRAAGWIQEIAPYFIYRASTVNRLENLRAKHGIACRSFSLRINSSTVTSKKVQYYSYKNSREGYPWLSEGEILRGILESRYMVPPGYPPGNIWTEHDIAQAMRKINSIYDLASFIEELDLKEPVIGNAHIVEGEMLDRILEDDLGHYIVEVIKPLHR